VAAQNWSFISSSTPAGGVRLTTTNGDACYIFGVKKDRTALINFQCSTVDAKTFTITEDTSTCIFTINVQSPKACPGGGGSGGGSSDALSGGSVFLIIFFVGAFVYVAGGCLYKHVKQGTSGVESCPNIDFWRDLPGLIKDGFSFIKNGCKKGGDSSYDEL